MTETFARWNSVQFQDSDVPEARSGHTAIMYNDEMIIFGGCGDRTSGAPATVMLSDTYAFNFTQSSWRKLKCLGQLPVQVFGHSACLLGCSMYVFGGQDMTDVFSQLAFLALTPDDNNSHMWKELSLTSPRPAARWGHSAATIKHAGRDKMLICFGADMAQHFNDTWLYTPDIGWEYVKCSGNIPEPRRRHTAVLCDDNLYVCGGRSLEHFYNDLHFLNCNNFVWRQLETGIPVCPPSSKDFSTEFNEEACIFKVPFSRTGHTACLCAPYRCMVLFGGLHVDKHRGVCTLNDVWVFDLRTHLWHRKVMCPPKSFEEELEETCMFYSDSRHKFISSGYPIWRSMAVSVVYKNQMWVHGGRDTEGAFKDMFSFPLFDQYPSLFTILAWYMLDHSIPYE